MPPQPKRIIVCCDGTWVNSLGPRKEPPSNVTRLSRVLRRVCSDGTSQVILYCPGVGTGWSKFDQFTGGAFGMGLDSEICQAYNFVVANYVDGDSIILAGFSRGAFTARSVADMLACIGLLTSEGMEQFYPIFTDYENMGEEKRPATDFLYGNLTPYNGEKGKEKIAWEMKRKNEYREWLKTKRWTRDTYQNSSTLIKINALAVWDTVGSLGIPSIPVFGFQGSAKQWKFTNTQVSHKVENAFQALALDEPRAAFRPALWERINGNNTNLKQVWFPGNHGGIGGGWYDQQTADISFAWMCDQLSAVGVEFNIKRMHRAFMDGLRYAAAHPYPYVPLPLWRSILGLGQPDARAWAGKIVCPGPKPGQKIDAENCVGKDHHAMGSKEELWSSARLWALGQTRYPDSWIQNLAGTITRHPGTFMRVNPDTNADTNEPLLRTSERIHSSVRIRLACQGLSMDDKETWGCQSLLKDDQGRPLWRLEHKSGFDEAEVAALKAYTPRELRANGDPAGDLYRFEPGDGQWRWVLDERAAVRRNAPGLVRVLPEEPMTGYWERYLLALMRGKVDVWRLAEDRSANDTK